MNATNANVGSIVAGGSISISNTISQGKVDAGGSIKANNSSAKTLDAGGSITVISSKVLNKTDAGGSITANRCEQLGSVKAGGSVDIDECPNISSISAGGHITLNRSKITENVSGGGNATVTYSQIAGRLTCSSNHLIIEGSEIDTIDLRCSGSGNISISMIGGNIMIGSGTNRNNVFIDGVPLSQLQANKSATTEKKEIGPKQVLELKNSTVKNVIFEGGNGEIILIGDSIAPTITGGKIKE